MIIEEYKKKLENWKEEHTNFYNECFHAMKNRKATLGAFMHIYDLPCLSSPICLNKYNLVLVKIFS